jgi:hypothetical protein
VYKLLSRLRYLSCCIVLAEGLAAGIEPASADNCEALKNDVQVALTAENEAWDRAMAGDCSYVSKIIESVKRRARAIDILVAANCHARRVLMPDAEIDERTSKLQKDCEIDRSHRAAAAAASKPHMSEPALPPPPTVVVQGMQTGGAQASGPIVDARSLRAQQGNCSDITGVGGGPGPSNCTQTNVLSPAIQNQIAQAKNYSQGNNPASLRNAADQYRRIEAELQAAGDLANAAIAAEEALALEDLLAVPSSATNSCPAAGPKSYWQNTANSNYCEHANCFERGTAYYGMLCFPLDCAAKLKALDGRNLPKTEIENLMGRGSPRCNADGFAMTPREMMMFDKRHHKNWGTSAAEDDN